MPDEMPRQLQSHRTGLALLHASPRVYEGIGVRWSARSSERQVALNHTISETVGAIILFTRFSGVAYQDSGHTQVSQCARMPVYLRT
jgi:hypothetical protein